MQINLQHHFAIYETHADLGPALSALLKRNPSRLRRQIYGQALELNQARCCRRGQRSIRYYRKRYSQHPKHWEQQTQEPYTEYLQGPVIKWFSAALTAQEMQTHHDRR